MPRRHDMRFTSFLLVLAIFITGCEEPSLPDDSTSSKSSPAATASKTSVSSSQAVTESEAQDFARALERSFVDQDHASYCRLMNMGAIAKEAMSGIGFPPKYQKRILRDLVKGMINERGESSLLLAMYQTGGEQATYRLLRIYEEDEKKHVLFRINGDSGVNYHDLTLSKEQGVISAVRMFVYLSGEQVSASMRRALLPLAQEASKNWLTKKLTTESEYVKHFDKVALMGHQNREGDYTGVLKTYDSLPESLKKEKNLLILRHLAAGATGEEELLKTLQDFKRYHPQEVCLDFLLVDYHILKENFDEALKCIDKIDQAVGGDEFLNVLRGNVLFEAGKKTESLGKFEQAIAAVPEIIDGYYGLLTVSLELERHDLTLEALNQLEKRFELSVIDGRDQPEYKKFLTSEFGEQWLNDHGIAAGE